MLAEHPHAQLIRDFHDLQNRFYAGGKQNPAGALLTEDVIWHVPGQSAIAAEYRGRDEVLRHFLRRRELSEASFRITVRGVLADEERVVILATGQCIRRGQRFQWQTISIFRVEQGRIAECWVIPYDPVLFDSIWGTPRSA